MPVRRAGRCGEWADRASLELPGDQPALLGALASSGTPLAVVLVGGRPATFGGSGGAALLRNVSALLVAMRPGQLGGEAIARLEAKAQRLNNTSLRLHLIPASAKNAAGASWNMTQEDLLKIEEIVGFS